MSEKSSCLDIHIAEGEKRNILINIELPAVVELSHLPENEFLIEAADNFKGENIHKKYI